MLCPALRASAQFIDAPRRNTRRAKDKKTKNEESQWGELIADSDGAAVSQLR